MKLWSDDIEVGSILRSRGGLLRVVRHISYPPPVTRTGRRYERMVMIYFSIKRCSWTRACYTLYSAAELQQLGYKKTGKKVDSLDTELDRAILNDIGKDGRSRQLTCCSVEGIS